ncbi:MAG: carbohydrate-binding protein [Verrucomicrobiota bacterium]
MRAHCNRHMMNSPKTPATRWLVACGMSLLPLHAQAWEPNAKELDAALKAGDFTAYFSNVSAWLNRQVPAAADKITDATLQALLKDPVFSNTLDQRQFIAKLGADKAGAFAKADPANPELFAALLKDTRVMDLWLEAVGPTPIPARDQNGYGLATESLNIWKKILAADPQAKEGIYQRLAIATAIAPPGTGAPGAGQAKTPVDPLERYKHFKAAQQNKELFASFDKLTVWEYTKVVQSGASNEDLAWAREMVNSWRPDLRIHEQVVDSTREVWRRNSPISFDNSYKNVLAGGGKCGPRSSWAVFICQAFGIPAIGVGQPQHACVAAKSAYPEIEPQPGSAWKVHQGMGWQVSKLEGTNGPGFLEAVEERAHPTEFSQIEHLRWLASALVAKEAADAVRTASNKLRQALPAHAPIRAGAPAIDPNVEGVAKVTPSVAVTPATTPEEPVKVTPGTLHIEAEAFTKSFAEAAYPAEQKGCVYVLDCYTGGKQLNLQKNMQTCWVDYAIDVPAAGTYAMIVRATVVNMDQVLEVSTGDTKLATISIPNTYGVWTTTPAVEVKLDKGPQTLRLSAPMQRGVAIRWFELKAK